MMHMLPAKLYYAVIVMLSMLLLAGCTAQQWQSTKEVLAVTALVGLAVMAQPTPVVTHCETIAHANTIRTICATY